MFFYIKVVELLRNVGHYYCWNYKYSLNHMNTEVIMYEVFDYHANKVKKYLKEKIYIGIEIKIIHL